MLLKLSISHFAIIKEMVFEPHSGLNIITGETGAGKSIILDALNLILGSRADIKTQSEWGEKCVVEGEFALDAAQYADLFKTLDIDFEAVTIIRKEINTNGKTRTFVNDSPVSLAQLKTLSERLINIHSQHENSHLNDREFQFSLVDSFAGHTDFLRGYRQAYQHFRQEELVLEELLKKQENLLKEKDYLSFLLNEFEQADLKPDEEDRLEQELNLLSHAEQLSLITEELIQTVSDSEQSVCDSLNQIKNKFRALAELNKTTAEIADRLQSCIIELKDISSETESLKAQIQADPGRLEDLNERLNLIQQLKRKHHTEEYAELLSVHENLADQLLQMGNLDSEIDRLKKSLEQEEKKLVRQAETLHQERMHASVALKKKIEGLLQTLEMPHAQINFEWSRTERLNHLGNSHLLLTFTANLGMPAQPLNKVASGGELSRLALCIRSIEAGQKQLNTLLFDEIDTGVSGKVADTIGKMFRQISAKHQVIAITHLPQVAGYGAAHYMVCKKEEQGSTQSYLKQLDQTERVEELAKMLSGNESTAIAKKNARELLKV